MRLEPGVDARLVDLDHEVAVVVIGQRGQYGVEVDDSEARLAPQPLGRRQLVVRLRCTLVRGEVVGEDVLDVNAVETVCVAPDERGRLDPAQRRWPVSGPKPITSGPSSSSRAVISCSVSKTPPTWEWCSGRRPSDCRTWQMIPQFSMVRRSRSALKSAPTAGWAIRRRWPSRRSSSGPGQVPPG